MKNNMSRSRFELEVEGQIVFADYRTQDTTLIITHVEAPIALRGKGAAGKLMEQVAHHAQSQNLRIRPLCSYAALWLQRHKEYAALVD